MRSYVLFLAVNTIYFFSITDNYGRNDLTDLQSELKILIHVGENENIVNILGACTKGNIYKASIHWIEQTVF